MTKQKPKLMTELLQIMYGLGITQTELAEKTGIKQPDISRIANGRMQATDGEKTLISKEVDKPIEEIFPICPHCGRC